MKGTAVPVQTRSCSNVASCKILSEQRHCSYAVKHGKKEFFDLWISIHFVEILRFSCLAALTPTGNISCLDSPEKPFKAFLLYSSQKY